MSQEFPPLFLGLNAHGKPYSIPLERHALTIAGSGAGKGACQIIPNLKGPHAWQSSAVVIDPAGEAAEESAVFRAKDLGQKVAIFDPFGFCRGDEIKPYLTSFNVLDLVTSSADLHLIADGIVKRSAHESNPHWNDSATEVIAGLLAYLLEAPSIPDVERHLGNLRAILTLVQAKDEATLAEMRACTCFADLASQTARRCAKADNETANILSTVQTQTKWLTFEEMAAWLALPSAVDLHELKTGRLTVFLVIPPDMLDAQGQFLRLFVRAAFGVMQERMADGSRLGTRCLMILDEFYSLGRLSQVQTAAAQMRKFGLHLWPFLQDWGQLAELYSEEGAQAFLANCDAFCAFGLDDQKTPQLVSDFMGRVTGTELHPALMGTAITPEARPLTYPNRRPLDVKSDHIRAAVRANDKRLNSLRGTATPEDLGRARYEHENQLLRQSEEAEQRRLDDERETRNRMQEQQAALQRSIIMARHGTPRMAPDAVAALVMLDTDLKHARKMLVRRPGNQWYILTPHPYYRPEPETPEAKAKAVKITPLRVIFWIFFVISPFAIAGILSMLGLADYDTAGQICLILWFALLLLMAAVGLFQEGQRLRRG